MLSIQHYIEFVNIYRVFQQNGTKFMALYFFATARHRVMRFSTECPWYSVV